MLQSDSTDLSGRKRMAGNVLATWAGHSIFILGGFVLPRMIDHRLGQELLGVWDFAWSLVNYFSLVQVGIVGSVSRFVAMYRAKNDFAGFNRAVSSVTCVLLFMSVIVILLTWATIRSLSSFGGPSLRMYLEDARWVVLLLGF